MRTIGLMENTIQFYAWGSASAIPKLMEKKNPSGKPWAELWMGAHPKAPSLVNSEGRWLSLLELTRNHPHNILGRKTAKKFGDQLPYLFKVLAAAKPLSIQAHPDLNQAKQGYEREDRLAIPLDAPNRNYKDDNHKPECLCALSEFWALSGFRPVPEIITLMTAACPEGLAKELRHLKTATGSEGLKTFYSGLMSMAPQKQKQVIAETLQRIDEVSDQDSAYWVKRLTEAYPTDIGVLSPMFLNLTCLKPGQAIFLPAGELHAYLEGLGIELMANSDNVLRGGLTPKHIDLPELLKVVNFKPRPIQLLNTTISGGNEKIFSNPASEFVLSSITVLKNTAYVSATSRSVEMLLCTNGEAVVEDKGTHQQLRMRKGQSVIIPAVVKSYTIEGRADIYKAAVPV